MFSIKKISLNRNPFIGLFLKANDSVVLVPTAVPKKLVSLAEKTLGAKHKSLFVNQSPLLGIFIALNNKGAVLPKAAGSAEKKILGKLGLKVCSLESPYSPGNVVLANDRAALVSPLVPKADVKKIGECLGVKTFQQSLAGLSTVGASSVVTNRGLLAYNEASEVELKFLEKIFGVYVIQCSTNLGVPFNAISVVANSRGALIGELTTGIEAQRVYEALSD